MLPGMVGKTETFLWRAPLWSAQRRITSIDFLMDPSCRSGYLGLRVNPPSRMARLDWYIRANPAAPSAVVGCARRTAQRRRVASYLHVSQPAVSKSLAALGVGHAADVSSAPHAAWSPPEHGARLIRHRATSSPACRGSMTSCAT